ncbi:MAG: ankyrin repeat domain-containing protein [Gammaproteobacteria bacterium]|nr:ankyrin repeat domain-containing protein [Gammaproteobacteria bacterium]
MGRFSHRTLTPKDHLQNEYTATIQKQINEFSAKKIEIKLEVLVLNAARESSELKTRFIEDFLFPCLEKIMRQGNMTTQEITNFYDNSLKEFKENWLGDRKTIIDRTRGLEYLNEAGEIIVLVDEKKEIYFEKQKENVEKFINDQDYRKQIILSNTPLSETIKKWKTECVGHTLSTAEINDRLFKLDDEIYENDERLKELRKEKEHEFNKIDRSLHRLCHEGQLEAIKAMFRELKFASLVRIAINTPDTSGYYPLHYAVENGHLEVIQHLLKQITTEDLIEMKDFDGYSPAHYVFVPTEENALPHENLRYPLISENTLISINNSQKEEDELSSEIDMVKKESHEELPLDEQATRVVQEDINLDFLQKGIEVSASSVGISGQNLPKNNGKQTLNKNEGIPEHENIIQINEFPNILPPKMQFYHENAIQMLEEFVKKGLSLECISNRDANLLHMAAYDGHIEGTKALITLLENTLDENKYIDFLNASDIQSKTALHMAVNKNHPEIVEVLLNTKHLLSCPEASGWAGKGKYTPLVEALIQDGRVECALHFLKKGIWLSQEEKDCLISEHPGNKMALLKERILTVLENYIDVLFPSNIQNNQLWNPDPTIILLIEVLKYPNPRQAYFHIKQLEQKNSWLIPEHFLLCTGETRVSIKENLPAAFAYYVNKMFPSPHLENSMFSKRENENNNFNEIEVHKEKTQLPELRAPLISENIFFSTNNNPNDEGKVSYEIDVIKKESLEELPLDEQATRVVQQGINSDLLQKGIEASLSSKGLFGQKLSENNEKQILDKNEGIYKPPESKF